MPPILYIPGGSDSVVKLWSIDVCVTSADLEGHVAPITCVALARDEAFALSGSEDKTVKIWNIFSSSVIINYKVGYCVCTHIMLNLFGPTLARRCSNWPGVQPSLVRQR